MIFDRPLLLMAAPLVALGVGLLAATARHRRIGAATAWSATLGERARASGRASPWVAGAAALLATLALAGPRGGRTEVTTETRALNLVLAVDISRSMLAEDVPPSRLVRSVREARRLVQDLEGDRIGLIAFAGRSYILSPLTVDGGSISLFLDALDPDLASQGGTSLAATLGQGRQLLEATGDAADRVLLLFTDGEAHDSLDDVLREAKGLKESGVRLLIVAQGGELPARIPLRDSVGRLVAYKQDAAGQLVETRRRDDVLRRVAAAADGTVIPSTVPDQAGAVREIVASLKRVPTVETRAADLIPLGWIPLLLAGLLLAAHTLTRRGAALVGLAALCWVPSVAAQRPSEGERALRAGDPETAAAAFLAEARAGTGADTAYYNAGTAALEAGRFEVARRALQEAAKSLDPDVRYRALYNLGVLGLYAAATDSTRRDTLLADAATSLRQALLLQPGSARAKWNLELAERRRPPPPPPAGGGSNSPPPPPQSGANPAPRPATGRPSEGQISQAQAEEILNSVEREERGTRQRQLRRLPGQAGGEKDW